MSEAETRYVVQPETFTPSRSARVRMNYTRSKSNHPLLVVIPSILEGWNMSNTE